MCLLEHSRKRLLLELAACLGISTGLFALGFFTVGGLFLVPLSLLIPMPFIFLRTRTNLSLALAGIIAFALLVYAMAGEKIALVYLCCTLVIALACGYAVRRRMSFYYTALSSMAATFAAFGILLLGIWLLWGNSLYGIMLDSIEAALHNDPELTSGLYGVFSLNSYAMGDEASVIPILTENVSTAVMADRLMLYFPSLLSESVTQLIVSALTLFGLLYYIVPRVFIKKAGSAVGPIPTFSMWSLPKNFGIWSIILIFVAIIGANAGWNNFGVVSAIVLGMFNIIYSIQGMAFVDWLLKKKINSVAGRVAIIAVTYIVFALVVQLYMWLGLFEQIVKFRKREALGAL